MPTSQKASRIAPSRWLALLVLAAGLCGGCTAVETLVRKVDPFTSSPDPDLLTQDELSQQLGVFSDYFAQVIQTAGRDIRKRTDDPAVQRSTMTWGLISIRTVRTSLLADDPQLGFLDVWVFCAQMRDFFSDGEGRSLFGKDQSVAIAAVAAVEERIEVIGALFLNPDQLAKSNEEVEDFAAAHPLSGQFARAAALPSTSRPEELGALKAVLDVPMSPFRVFSGIDAGAAAVTQFSVTTERFARRFESLPEETLWELDLLLFDLEQRGVVVDLRKDFGTFAESSTRLAGSAESFAQTADTLPEDVRKEVEILFERLESEQAELQKTITATRAAMDDARTTMTEAKAAIDESSVSVQAASEGVAAAGDAWKGTIKTYHEMVADLYPPGAEPAPKDDDKKPFDINEYTAAAEGIADAAKELRMGIAELQDLLGGEALKEGTGEVEKAAGAAAEAVAVPARDVVDHAAWRALQLALVCFGLALVYRVVSYRWLTRPRSLPRATKLE